MGYLYIIKEHFHSTFIATVNIHITVFGRQNILQLAVVIFKLATGAYAAYAVLVAPKLFIKKNNIDKGPGLLWVSSILAVLLA